MFQILPEPWMCKADCVGHDPDTWFPEPGAGGQQQSKQAKAICQQCPVQTECLNYARAHRIEFGIWGGFTWADRRKMGRKRVPGQCLNGHVQDERTSYICSKGYRVCRICKRGFATDQGPTKWYAGTR